MSVIDEVAAERVRQVFSEGYDAEHDDLHVDRELADAAAAYVLDYCGASGWAVQIWPWTFSDYKIKDARDHLIRAAALIVAEIERLDRAAS